MFTALLVVVNNGEGELDMYYTHTHTYHMYTLHVVFDVLFVLCIITNVLVCLLVLSYFRNNQLLIPMFCRML